MSSSLLNKASLRVFATILVLLAFVGIVVWLIYEARKELVISGSIDAAQLVTAFITATALIIGWLFGRREQQ